MSEKKQLMADFPPVSSEKWREAIEVDLKGADYERRLVWKTVEGFSVEPFNRAEDLSKLQHMGRQAGEYPFVNGTRSCNDWRVRQTIRVENAKDANKEALKVLMRGVNSLGLEINSNEFTVADLDTLLKEIELRSLEIVITGCGAGNASKLFMEKVVREKLNADEVRALFGLDPLKRGTRKGGFCKNATCFDDFAQLLKLTEAYKHIRVISVGGTIFNSAGSSSTQELAFTLAMGHEYIVKLMEKGLKIDQIAQSMHFNFAVDSGYFMEIAKFRAARMLWANIVKAYKPERNCSLKMKAHAVTSDWNMSVYDPYVNMLRGTTESMSAAIAGVNSIEVLPFDHPFSAATDFSSRIARNTQLLLKEESHFDQVVDPSAGSYYIETLTDKIAKAAWELFKEVEKLGGYTAALKSEYIQKAIKTTADILDKNIETRRKILLGTNQYPNFGEIASKTVTSEMVTRQNAECSTSKACGCGADKQDFTPLVPYRGAMAFEELRLATDRAAKRPTAFMLTCGTLAFARARAQFACNFFAVAGFKVVDNTYFASVEEGAKAALKAKAEIVVICAADADYAAVAVEAKKLIGNNAIVVVAGAPESRPELEKAGITHFISARDNVYKTLQQYKKELGI